ncbi:MAG TPA: hypothetical protein VF861_11465 [Telluria sp.]
MHLKRAARRYIAALHATPWHHVFGYALLGLFFGKMLAWTMPAGLRYPFNTLVLIAAALMVVAKDLAGTPQFLQRVRAVSVNGTGWRDRLVALFPPEFIALLRLDRALMRDFASWIMRRSAPPRPDGVKLTYLERGAYSTVVAIALFSVFVDIPINMFMVSVLPMVEPDQRFLLHLIFGLGAAYGLVWVLGDRWAVRGSYHVLTSGALDLQVGSRSSGTIPLAAIAASEPVKEKRIAWCRRRGVRVGSTLLVSPFDQPNLVLTLKPHSGVTLTHYQLEEVDPTYVFLYVDRPELLAAAIASTQSAGKHTP